MDSYSFVQEQDFMKARNKIRENSEKKIVFSTDNDELNRKILEKEKINVLLISQSKRKDKQKQRNSGFNQVLAKLAKKNSVAVGINLDEIIDSNKKEKAEILSRIKQNINLCKKNKLEMKFVAQKHKRNIYDLRALGLILGMPTSMVKKLNFEQVISVEVQKKISPFSVSRKERELTRESHHNKKRAWVRVEENQGVSSQ